MKNKNESFYWLTPETRKKVNKKLDKLKNKDKDSQKFVEYLFEHNFDKVPGYIDHDILGVT